MKRLAPFILFLLMPFLQAHEFWMQPVKFQYHPGERATIGFMLGGNFVGDTWEMKRSRFVRLDHITTSASVSLLHKLPEEAGKNFTAVLEKPGTHLLVMQSTNAYIELGAEEFNAYLKEDGLDDAYQQRKKSNTLDKPAREHFARCIKLLLQAGDNTDDTPLQPSGMPLEIVPLANPYALKQGDPMSFKVLYNGKPLPYAMVKVWNRRNNNTVLQTIFTQKDGTVATRLGNSGHWMISCVHMVPSTRADADWQSYWASFVFGL